MLDRDFESLGRGLAKVVYICDDTCKQIRKLVKAYYTNGSRESDWWHGFADADVQFQEEDDAEHGYSVCVYQLDEEGNAITLDGCSVFCGPAVYFIVEAEGTHVPTHAVPEKVLERSNTAREAYMVARDLRTIYNRVGIWRHYSDGTSVEVDRLSWKRMSRKRASELVDEFCHSCHRPSALVVAALDILKKEVGDGSGRYD